MEPEQELEVAIPHSKKRLKQVESAKKWIARNQNAEKHIWILQSLTILLSLVPFLFFGGILAAGLLDGYAYFAMSLLSLLWSFGAQDYRFPFFLGTVAVEAPLVIIIPHFLIFILCLAQLSEQTSENLPSYFSNISPTNNNANFFGFVGVLLGILASFFQLLHLIYIIKGIYHSASALKAAGIECNEKLRFNWWFALFPNLTGYFFHKVTEEKDVVYAKVKVDPEKIAPAHRKHFNADNGDLKLKANVYYRDDGNESLKPAILYIHGGAWMFGSKDGAILWPIIYKAANEGWVVVSIDYQLAPYATFPSQLIDCKRALAWMRGPGGQKYNIDPNTVVVTGDSAGGHLAQLLALTMNQKDLQPGFEESDTSVQGCCEFFGPQDMKDSSGHFQKIGVDITGLLEFFLIQKAENQARDLYTLVSPLELVKSVTSPPCPWMSMQGSRDGLSPVKASRSFYQEFFKNIDSEDAWTQSIDKTKLSGKFCCGAKEVVRIEHKGGFHGFNSFPMMRGQAVTHFFYSFATHCHKKSSEQQREVAKYEVVLA